MDKELKEVPEDEKIDRKEQIKTKGGNQRRSLTGRIASGSGRKTSWNPRSSGAGRAALDQEEMVPAMPEKYEVYGSLFHLSCDAAQPVLSLCHQMPVLSENFRR